MKKQTFDTKNWDKQFNKLENIVDNIVDDVNIYLLKFFKSSFDTKSFNNVQWKPSRNNRNTLVDTGELKRSIKTVSKSIKMIHIQSDLPYSKIHNEGGIIKVTDKMRKFFWAKFYETNNDDWKWMAISKKISIKMPKRQFIGIPNNLKQEIEEIIQKYI